ncbi:hypothetical protein DD237_008569 [Peronospora effusa]|uniref:Purple acid phosphatase n=1 Tax=Peronospora effusa TaxID=542832 RepID=A0A3R8CP46_9STRA|nr:hypothetical protein DD237_008569 [Peronospora effusa]
MDTSHMTNAGDTTGFNIVTFASTTSGRQPDSYTMRLPTAVKLAVVASALCSITSAKSTGFKSNFLSFFSTNDVADENANKAYQSSIDDRTCVYKWSSLSCEPKDKCSIQYQFGDVTPSQACRVTRTGDLTKIPQQLHVAFAGEKAGTGMAISWTTFALEEVPAVWIGANESTISQVKSAKIVTKSYYKEDDYSLYNYHAVVTELEPNTEYFYKVGSSTNTKAQSAVSSFKTARSSGDESSFVVAMYGDMGTDANAVAANKYVNNLAGKVDFIFHLGDISYADNGFVTVATIFGFFYEEIWNKFMNSMTHVMRRMAYMVVVGNHEAECHSPTCLESTIKKDQLGNYSAFNARFRMPSLESGGVLNMWYSFEYASVHFTAISTETDYPNAPTNAYYTKRIYGNFGKQLDWLEADLKAAHANRAIVPWVVVCMHRPIYSLRTCNVVGQPEEDGSIEVQKAFEELLIKYEVDLVYQGHVHAYERHFPTANSKAIMTGVSKDRKTYTDPEAPVYVITGSAGNSERLFQFRDPPSPEWLAHMDCTHYGITKLSVTPTNLTVTMVEAATDTVYDEFSIIKTLKQEQRNN